jgi:hypothetical protein
MILHKMKFLVAAASAVALIASLVFGLTVHNEISADPTYGATTVAGPDGKLIGVAPNTNTRSHLNELLDVE